MKKFFTLLSLCFVSASFAQISADADKAGSDQVTNLTNQRGGQLTGGGMTFFNPPRAVDGSEYLFDDWKNYAIIHTEDNQRFALNNINLNIVQNAFVSKIDGDSLFTFNFNNVKKVNINGKDYKNFYWNDDNRVYQIVYEGKGWSIIKGFKVVEITGSANPMLNRSRDRLVRKSFYYLKNDKGISPFKLKKKRILKLVNGDKEEAARIEAFARKNRLSFNKENELKQILEYSAKN